MGPASLSFFHEVINFSGKRGKIGGRKKRLAWSIILLEKLGSEDCRVFFGSVCLSWDCSAFCWFCGLWINMIFYSCMSKICTLKLYVLNTLMFSMKKKNFILIWRIRFFFQTWVEAHCIRVPKRKSYGKAHNLIIKCTHIF